MGNEILCGIAVPQKMHRLDFSPPRGPRDGGNDFLQHSLGIYRSFSAGICCNCPLFENFNFLDLRCSHFDVLRRVIKKSQYFLGYLIRILNEMSRLHFALRLHELPMNIA